MRYMELWTDLLSCPLWHRFWTTLWCCRLGTLTAPHCCLSCRWLNRNLRRERREKKKSGRQRRRPVDKVSVWFVWELLLYNRIQIINVLEFDTNCICVATKSWVLALYQRRTCTCRYYYPSGKYVLFAQFTLTCSLYHVFGIMEPLPNKSAVKLYIYITQPFNHLLDPDLTWLSR